MGASQSTESNLMASTQRHLSKIVVAPSFAASLFFCLRVHPVDRLYGVFKVAHASRMGLGWPATV